MGNVIVGRRSTRFLFKCLVLLCLAGFPGALFAKPEYRTATPVASSFVGRPAGLRCGSALAQQLFQISSVDHLLRNFKLMAWNLERFEIAPAGIDKDQLLRSKQAALANFKERDFKTEDELREIASIVEAEDPTVMIWSEVDVESAKFFASRYLRGRWSVLSGPSNDQSLHIVSFVKMELLPIVRLETYVGARFVDGLGQEFPAFVRDVPSLIMKFGSRNIVLQGVHAISQKERPLTEGQIKRGLYDPRNLYRRRIEFEGILMIQKYYEKTLSDPSFITAGDFNTDTQRATEYQVLKDRAVSFMDMTPASGNDLARVTHSFHTLNREGQTIGTKYLQLDDILVDHRLRKSFVDGYVYRYLDKWGLPKPLPQTLEARLENPSDHNPVISIFDLTK